MFRIVNFQKLVVVVFTIFSGTVCAASKMSEVVTNSKLSEECKDKVIQIADHLIGKKGYQILGKNISNSEAFHAFILLSYNDQDSHITLTATPQKTGSSCLVNMEESYQSNELCLDERQTVFKRWEYLGMGKMTSVTKYNGGKLKDRTYVVRYDKPRKKEELIEDTNARAMAFLTQTFTRYGPMCLVTKQQQNMPYPPKQDEE